MAESDYDGSNAWDTPKVAENGDGTGTFWENSFKKLVNRTKYIYERTMGSGRLFVLLSELASQEPGVGASLVGGRSADGTGMSIPALDVQSLIGWLADNVPGLTYLASTTINASGSLRVGAEGYAGLLHTIAGGTVRSQLRHFADYALSSEKDLLKAQGVLPGALTASSASVSIDSSKPLWEHHGTWANGTTIECTVDDYAGTEPAHPVIDLLVSSLNGVDGAGSSKYEVQRSGGTVLARFELRASFNARGNGAHVKLRWAGSQWNLLGAWVDQPEAGIVAVSSYT